MAITRFNVCGSITVLVSCVMTVLLIFSTLLVRSGTQTLDLALQRVTCEQRSQALTSFVCYADGVIKAYLPTLSILPAGTRIVHEIATWPLDTNSMYSGRIIIEIQAKKITVTTVLKDKDDMLETTKDYTRL